jgi:hypothetical protein
MMTEPMRSHPALPTAAEGDSETAYLDDDTDTRDAQPAGHFTAPFAALYLRCAPAVDVLPMADRVALLGFLERQFHTRTSRLLHALLITLGDEREGATGDAVRGIVLALLRAWASGRPVTTLLRLTAALRALARALPEARALRALLLEIDEALRFDVCDPLGQATREYAAIRGAHLEDIEPIVSALHMQGRLTEARPELRQHWLGLATLTPELWTVPPTAMDRLVDEVRQRESATVVGYFFAVSASLEAGQLEVATQEAMRSLLVGVLRSIGPQDRPHATYRHWATALRTLTARTPVQPLVASLTRALLTSTTPETQATYAK